MNNSVEAVVATVSKINSSRELEKEFEERAKAKHAALVKLQDIDQGSKDKIRDGMTFRLVDKKGKKKEKSFDSRGQEHAIDSEGSVKKGRGLSSEDQVKVQAAMDEIVRLTRQALDAEVKPGVKVFDPTPGPNETPDQAVKRINDEIERDIFTPLVREGLLPETFVLSKYSEVAKLIQGAMGSYKESTQEVEDEKKTSTAKMDANLHGAGAGTFDRVSAIGAKAKQKVDNLKRSVISEKNERYLGIAVEGGKLIQKGIAAQSSIKSMANGKALENADKFLNPQDYRDDLSEDRQETFDSTSDTDKMRTLLAQQKREEKYIKYFNKIPFFVDNPEKAGKALEAFHEKLEQPGVTYTKMSANLLKDLIKDGVSIGIASKDLADLNKEIDEATVELQIQDAAARAVEKLDAGLVAAIAKVNATAGVAFDGVFSSQASSPVDSACCVKDPGIHIIGELAKAYESAFTAAAPPSAKSGFASAGKQIGKAILATKLGSQLNDGIKEDVDKAFQEVVTGINKVVSQNVAGTIEALVNDEDTVKEMLAASLDLESEENMDAIFQAEEEIKEYERLLVLIDDGGMSAAEMRSIENLIMELQKERQVLELVAKLGGSITGAATSSVKIAESASEQLTSVVAGEVVGALKAAKLVMQLAINAKKAADRWALWSKFKTNLKRSKIAVSSLTSTIQGFYNNKKEQIAFRTIEDALMAVELAATIIGTVPHPYTIAIGKTMTAVNAAAQQAAKVSEMIYNEAMLQKAWSTTKAAMDNPADRALGLQALRLNPTLGMHALAWAGMEKQPPDPVARMTLDSLGLNEQTLAVSGTEGKVRQYLETLLNEDRKLLDPNEIKTNWLPPSMTLTVKDWFIVFKRAERDAHPPLQKDDPAAIGIVVQLKYIDEHDLDSLEELAKKGEIEEPIIEKHLKEINVLIDKFYKFEPKTKDREIHDEMAGVAATYLALASKHRDRLEEIEQENAMNRNPSRLIDALDEIIATFEQVIESEEVQKEVLVAKFDELRNAAKKDVEAFSILKAAENDEVQELLKTMNELLTKADKLIEDATKQNQETLAV